MVTMSLQLIFNGLSYAKTFTKNIEYIQKDI